MIRPICLCLALVPFGWGLLQNCRAPSVRAMTASAPRPALAFDQYSLDSANVGTRPLVQAYYNFTNNGTQPLRITKLDPSCGCIKPRLENGQTEYLPGEVGRFFVQLATAGESPGPKEFTVQVHYDDGQPHEQTVAWRMTLPEKKLTVEPREVYFYQVNGQSDSRTIYVTDHRHTAKIEQISSESIGKRHPPLELVDLQIKAFAPAIGRNQDETPPKPRPVEGLFTATIGDAEETDEGRRIPIRIDVPGLLPPGRTTALVAINTTDPDFPKLYVSVLLEGQPESQ